MAMAPKSVSTEMPSIIPVYLPRLEHVYRALLCFTWISMFHLQDLDGDRFWSPVPSYDTDASMGSPCVNAHTSESLGPGLLLSSPPRLGEARYSNGLPSFTIVGS